jgi:signal peptidase II
MTQGSRIALVVIVLLATAGCDHATKAMARNALAGSLPLSLGADTVRFELVTNPGAFLSMGAALPDPVRDVIFLGAIPILLAVVCALALRSGLRSPMALVGLGFVAGGGLANWLDRLMNDGHVTDFVSIGFGALRTGIFNVADVMIFAGVGLIVLASRNVEEPAPGEPAGG